MSSILLLVLLILLSFQVSSVSLGSHVILQTLSGPNIPDAAADLNNTSFDEVLKNSPATFSIVEFFAHWCPACRNYKPHYENVARLFNGPDAAHPGVVFMARVDCASKINTKLCDRFSGGHYPMLLWGPPSKFASGGWEPKQDKSEMCLIDDGRTADHLLNWINKQLGR
ncbi:sulfhydryl oxidase 2-like [Telopea speciosissima]|uniref:sulfhydryl oxidase 2-like n=1 Tax=Telopea speciosissima TaxID=54955 RepID=UPI001CC60959|nr:sulfhydryl oxidase 2-like [Telopea speciosissima]